MSLILALEEVAATEIDAKKFGIRNTALTNKFDDVFCKNLIYLNCVLDVSQFRRYHIEYEKYN